MSVILILILASLAVALAFLAGFIWAVKAGQFEDTCTPAMRILSEDEAGKQGLPETKPARAVARQVGMTSGPASGVRPSSGAATSASSKVAEPPSALIRPEAAAPEDGRTPSRSPSMAAAEMRTAEGWASTH